MTAVEYHRCQRARKQGASRARVRAVLSSVGGPLALLQGRTYVTAVWRYQIGKIRSSSTTHESSVMTLFMVADRLSARAKSNACHREAVRSRHVEANHRRVYASLRDDPRLAPRAPLLRPAHDCIARRGFIIYEGHDAKYLRECLQVIIIKLSCLPPIFLRIGPSCGVRALRSALGPANMPLPTDDYLTHFAPSYSTCTARRERGTQGRSREASPILA
jgi:hypothetical protein